jgi:hypothetical protein
MTPFYQSVSAGIHQLFIGVYVDALMITVASKEDIKKLKATTGNYKIFVGSN